MKATCTSCGAAILWTVTEAGKRMPVDAVPTGKVTVLVKNPNDESTPISRSRDHYVSHFATCVSAAQHRTPKTKATEQVSPEADDTEQS